MKILRSRSLHRLVRFVALAAFTLVASGSLSSAAGQEPRLKTVAGTGLFTLHRGHTVHVNLVQLGGELTQPTEVVLRLRDRSNHVLAQIHGELTHDNPLRLTMPGPSNGAVVFRAEAVLRTSTNNFDTAPVLTVEVVNTATFDTFVANTCAVPYDPEGTGGPVIGDCGGCHFLFAIEP